MALIDREAAIEAALDWNVKPGGEVFNAIKAAIRSGLEQVAVIDAVSVVRCKDCQHCWADSNKKQRFDPMKHHWWYCDNLDMDNRADDVPPEKWFCADGKRKEN